jgi:site-specific DNA-methyltransferase (adenine-specific)
MYTLEKGNCIQLMKQMADKSVDCIVTDPPWGVGIDYGVYQDTACNLKEMIPQMMPEMLRIAHRVIILCGTKYMHCYPHPTWVMAWVYPAGGGGCPWGFTCWQPILCYGKDPYLANRMGGRPDVFTKLVPQKCNTFGHPTPKPLNFMMKLIERVSVKKTDRILDPFMGSGTTGVAAVQLGRDFVGFDINPRFIRIAEKRIMEAANDNEPSK